MHCASRYSPAQKELGVVPQDAELTRPPRRDSRRWDDMPAELKPVLARQMEIYAGFLEQTDHQVGRLVDAIDELGVLDDTLVYYIIGDNGASAEGTLNGAFNEMAKFNGMAALETPGVPAVQDRRVRHPGSYNHYAVGWAWAMGTPYQWTKQVASHWGGTRNGTIVHWPNGIGGARARPATVPPRHRCRADHPRGGRYPRAGHREQRRAGPLEGVSMLATLRDGDAAESHDCSTSRCSAIAASTTTVGRR